MIYMMNGMIQSSVYDFYYDLSSELYDEDKDGVAKEMTEN